MKRIVLAAAVAGVLTVGTASASSLGLSGSDTVFATDTVVLADCTVDDVLLTPELPAAGATSGAVVTLASFSLVGASSGCTGGVVQLVLYDQVGTVMAVLDDGFGVAGPQTVSGVVIFGDIAAVDVVVTGVNP